MSDHQADYAERLVITARDVAALEPPSPAPKPAEVPSKLPWWAIATGSLLTLCLPLLCSAAIAVRLLLRRRDLATRAAWNGFLCTLLIVSGFLFLGELAYVGLTKVPSHEAAQLPFGLISHDLTASFPALPASSPMTPVEIAARMKPLVFIVTPEPVLPLGDAALQYSAVGAAVLLMADEEGYLLGTNRHVANPPTSLPMRPKERVLVVSNQGSYAYAEVVARHRKLDLALLWVARRSGHGKFRQPIMHDPEVAVGSSVFTIGHPQRLFFTLSSGLVSRATGDGIVQLSAPISPGNSGGPAYDSFGNLLGVVTYTVDKQANPNAENLNFATEADAFLTEEGWDFRAEGKKTLRRFRQGEPAHVN